MRLDNFVAELIRTSRTKATQIIEEGRVFINYEETDKASKAIKEGYILTIRGKRKVYYRKYNKNNQSRKTSNKYKKIQLE